MTVRGYRFLFVTYPALWRVRYEDEVRTVLQDADAMAGRRSASLRDRVGFLLDGLSHRLARTVHPVLLPLTSSEHRFDQTNGVIAEREPTPFENEHASWWDQYDVPAFVPVAMTGGRAQVRT